jgi:hypothetical protein
MLSFKDWWLPSLYEIDEVYLQIHQYSLGDFMAGVNDYYWTSTESSSTAAVAFKFYNENVGNLAKGTTSNMYIRPIRKFNSTKVYNLRDIGEAGGLIFYIEDIPGNPFAHTYYEVYIYDIGLHNPWSNITDELVSSFGEGIGDGLDNTNLIIAQSGHVSSAAYLSTLLTVVLNWTVKYLIQWTDILHWDWFIEILDQDYGEIEPEMIQATGDPLTIEWLSVSQNLLKEPIKGSIATIRIYSDQHFQWSKFYDYHGLKYKIKIYSGFRSDSNIYWQGFISSPGYLEPYDGVSYPVAIGASDGLGLLKTIPFKDGEDYYNGRQLLSTILLNILNKIGFDSFDEFINVYEGNMDGGIFDSPLDQAYIDVDLWKDKFCYEVLEDILKPFNAIIRQKDGILQILRPKELQWVSGLTGRHFSGIGSKVFTTIYSAQNLHRPSMDAVSLLVDYEGGSLTIQDPAKKITMNQDYGNKESWLDNYQFLALAFDFDSRLFDYWENSDGIVLKHISEFLVKETNGCAIGWTGSGSSHLDQSFGFQSILGSESDRFVIDLYFNWYNNNNNDPEAATNISITVSQNGNYLRQLNDTEAYWQGSPIALFSFTPTDIYGGSEIPPGFGDGWIQFKREFNGLADDGEIVISLAGNGYSEVYNCYKDIKFYTSHYKILKKIQKRKLLQRIIYRGGMDGAFIDFRNKYYEVKYKEFDEPVVENVITRENIDDGVELEFDYNIGDVIKLSDPPYNGDVGIENIIEQFAGALSYNAGDAQVDSILLIGDVSGVLNITNNGLSHWLIWSGYPETIFDARDAFVSAYYDEYLAAGSELTVSAETLYFTAIKKGVPFTGETTAENLSGDIGGIVTTETEPTNIFINTEHWETWENEEDLPLLELMANELLEFNYRTKQIIQLPINEFANEIEENKVFDVNGYIEDALNLDKAWIGEQPYRRFLINNASFDVRNRNWDVNLYELIRPAEI